MLRCRELGAFANERARAGFSRGTTFGPRHAVAERASARRLAQARARALSGGDDRHSRAAETLLHEAALVQMPSDDVVKLARLLDRERSAMERTREAEDRAALAQFHEENKARVQSDVEAVLPAHGQGAMELMAAPSSFGLSLVVARQSWVSKGATRVNQHLSGLPRSHGNLAVALDDRWQHLNRLLSEVAEPPASCRGDLPEPTRCWSERECV